jgi:DNA recombination protein RmuC
MQLALVFLLGALAGALVVWLIVRSQHADSAQVAQRLLEQTQIAKTRDVELIVANVKDSVRAETQTLFSQSVRELTAMMSDLQKERATQFGEIKAGLTRAATETDRLQSTTADLRKILANPAARGQWGERMAEDVLRLAGFLEGVNYLKQASAEGSATRPDFTFLLPRDLKVNMDVKFPFSSYLAYMESTGAADREQHRRQFIRDVRARIKEVTARDYIDVADGTLGYVLLFIPNEGIYSFIHECYRTVLDEALEMRVIVCSPFTLYAVLAVIRQAVDNFTLERTSNRMLELMVGFNKHWQEYVRSFDILGKRIAAVQTEFERLTTTRKSSLDRQLQKVEALSSEEGVEVPALDAEGVIPNEVRDLGSLSDIPTSPDPSSLRFSG